MPWRTALLAFLLFPAGACLKADAPALPLLSALAGHNRQTEAAAAQPVALSGTVTLRPRLLAHGPNVTLGDLVEQSLPPDVAAVAVKPAEGPGVAIDLDPALVALKLRRAPGGPYSLKSGYGRLRVEVPAQTVSGKILLDFARGYLDAQLSGTAGAAIQPQGKVFGLTLYDAQLRFRVRPPENHPLRGYVELRVDVLQSSANGEDKVVATVPVSFLVRRQEPRMVTTQAVNRGDALGSDNVAVQVMDTTFAADGFSDLQSIQDKVAKTYIPAGTPVDVDMVDLPLAIHAGDTVKLLVRSGAIEIDASARAVRDARVGDSLPLQITDTGKMVQARCVDMDVAVQNAW
ncbi:MAG TPA: flagellar basal body P-ring formation chaperone FlgA [bacterium]|jgi:flagella basal body P-ring formation protein FlgA|nr:flagellar basal body P-ring formation chaperone FlgA [bacterium]